MLKLGRKILYGILFFSICILCVLAFLIYKKKVSINNLLNKEYSVTGIDVSHYQGKIDWKDMKNNHIDFAFIKATEGSKSVDEKFKTNWENAQKNHLAVGAYHFFSFDSGAESQADNFIKTVGKLKGKLPPVIDFEYYGDKEKNLPDIEETRKELHRMLDILEQHYGEKPIIYATFRTYHRFIENEFDDYPLWIRNVYYTPDLDMRGKWKFWQYTDQGIIEGYHGDTKYIDMNAFYGTKEELRQLIVK